MSVPGRDDLAIAVLEQLVSEIDVRFDTKTPRTPPASRESAQHLVELLAGINTRIGGSVTELLEQIADQLRTPTAAAERLLPAEEIAALRKAGSFVPAMPDPVNRGSTRTAVMRQQLRLTALPLEDVRELLNVKDSRIRQRVANRTLHALKDVGQGRSFPAYQFTQTGTLHGWAEVGPAFPFDADLVSVAHVMTEPHPDLVLEGEQVSPREWLLAEQSPSVVVELVRQAYSIP